MCYTWILDKLTYPRCVKKSCGLNNKGVCPQSFKEYHNCKENHRKGWGVWV